MPLPDEYTEIHIEVVWPNKHVHGASRLGKEVNTCVSCTRDNARAKGAGEGVPWHIPEDTGEYRGIRIRGAGAVDDAQEWLAPSRPLCVG
eukprot:6178172-Pleurochrysis_carterae.AAC.2